MLSYQHIYHAGSPADIYKHAVLLMLMNDLKSQGGTVSYLETHAGRGLYDVLSEESDKTGEARAGILRLQAKKKKRPKWAAPLLNVIADIQKNHEAKIYPGSPMVAGSVLGRRDKLDLMELHPQEEKALRKTFAGHENVSVMKQDGYLGVGEMLKKNLSVFDEIMIMIDPSFEIKSEYEELAGKVVKMSVAAPQALIAIWYPMLPAKSHELMKSHLEDVFPDLWCGESLFEEEGVVRGMYGSGMILINCPLDLIKRLDKLTIQCEEYFMEKI